MSSSTTRVRKGEGVKPKPYRELRRLLASMSKTGLRIPNPKTMAAVKRGDDGDGQSKRRRGIEQTTTTRDRRRQTKQMTAMAYATVTAEGTSSGREQLKLRTPPPKPTKSKPPFPNLFKQHQISQTSSPISIQQSRNRLDDEDIRFGEHR
ncbi:hypothetical protein Scep_021839 [Stephania cephalantha]|uniref:Uncharacterized protein n=1 Tax=Stephania cephalantha TaxID=152367 RepID=A0AAP0F465_9MAGN